MMQIRNRIRRKGASGQAMVELALSLPVLLLVLFIIIEMTFAISAATTLNDAVHYGARLLAQKNHTRRDIETRVRKFLASDRYIDTDKVRIKIREGTDFNGKPNVTVEASLPMRPVSFSAMSEFNISARATFRREWRHGQV